MDTGTPIISSLSPTLGLLNANYCDEWGDVPELAESDTGTWVDPAELGRLLESTVPEPTPAKTGVHSLYLSLAVLQSSPEYLIYSQIPDDDPLSDYHTVEVGREDPGELDAAIEKMLKDAGDTKVLTTEGLVELSSMVEEYRHVFAVKMGGHEPADVPPLQIRLLPEAKPLRIPSRTHAPPQMRFMKEKLDEYESMGLIYKNPTAPWASPSLILLKPGPEKFLFIVDLRIPNSYTIPTMWPMPHLADSLTNFAGSKYFSKTDLVHGYWQFLLEQGSQECQLSERHAVSTLLLVFYTTLLTRSCTCSPS